MTLATKLGRRVRQLRERRGMTQREVAARGLWDHTFVSQIENGHNNVTLETLGELADALETNIATLVRGIDD